MNTLLRSQISKYLDDKLLALPQITAFLEAVNAIYEQFELDIQTYKLEVEKAKSLHGVATMHPDEAQAMLERNQELTSSLNYAGLIQRAYFDHWQELSAYFTNSMCINIPQQILSGDFYYFKSLTDEVVIALADCTGHGIAGAFLSTICYHLVNKNVELYKTATSADILRHIDIDLMTTLHKTDDNYSSRDGMDMALLKINYLQRTIEFASAKLSLYHITNGQLHEYKGERCRLGYTLAANEKKFNNHHIAYAPGDVLLLFTDGYYDQPGGLNGKKMKLSYFSQVINELTQLPFADIKNYLLESFESWKQLNSQIDDVMVLGLELK